MDKGQPDQPLVEIALATFQGMPFLAELLASIRAQSHENLRIVASDDGSDDGTLACLQAAAAQGGLVLVAGGPFRSVARNFESALRATRASYVALADQDDLWEPAKLREMLASIRAEEARHGAGVPVMAFCDLVIVDAQANTLAPSFFAATRKSARASRLRDFALNNHVPGCAMMVNRALLDRALPFPDAIMHDHWLAQVAAIFGRIVHLDKALVRYRQHGGNAVGLGATGRGRKTRAAAAWAALWRRPAHWRAQAAAIGRNMAALHERFGRQLPHTRDLALVEAIMTRDPRAMRRAFKGALHGERALDRLGLLYNLGRRSSGPVA